MDHVRFKLSPAERYMGEIPHSISHAPCNEEFLLRNRKKILIICVINKANFFLAKEILL